MLGPTAVAPCSFDMDSLSDQEGTAGKGHITNYAQNVNGTVWNLAMLKQHMGKHMDLVWVAGQGVAGMHATP